MRPLSVTELLCTPECRIGPEYVLCFCLTSLLQFFPSESCFNVEGNESFSDPWFLHPSTFLLLSALPRSETNASLVSGPLPPGFTTVAQVRSLKYNRRQWIHYQCWSRITIQQSASRLTDPSLVIRSNIDPIELDHQCGESEARKQ